MNAEATARSYAVAGPPDGALGRGRPAASGSSKRGSAIAPGRRVAKRPLGAHAPSVTGRAIAAATSRAATTTASPAIRWPGVGSSRAELLSATTAPHSSMT